MSVQRNGRFLWFWHGLDSILLLASFGLEYCICVSELQLINRKQSCCFLFCFAIDTLCISLHVELWFEIQFDWFSTNWFIHCQKSNGSPLSTGWFTVHAWGYHRYPPKPTLITRTILRRVHVLRSLHVHVIKIPYNSYIRVSNHSLCVVYSRYHDCWIKLCFSILWLIYIHHTMGYTGRIII